MKNYYEILEIHNNKCNQNEIKKKYRKLCLKYHPDKNNGDKDYEDRFKDIQEAYDVLSNEEKRKLYDVQYFFKDIDITMEDYELLLYYYNKIINSNEYKLFKLLYNSIPPKVKENLWEKFIKKNKKIVKANKSIDITELLEEGNINLLINEKDYNSNTLKIIYIFSRSGIYYLYLRKPMEKLSLNNENNYFFINFYIVK